MRVLALVVLFTLPMAAGPAREARGQDRRPDDRGRISDDALNEASGLVASRRYPGFLWAHNDSGDEPRLFLLGGDAVVHARVNLDGATARDWEDIAAGPGPVPDRVYLYVADIGDNERVRDKVRVFRVAEPEMPDAVLAQAAGDVRDLDSGPVETLTLTYPDGPRNAETLLIDPTSGDLVIVTKGSTTPEVYRARWRSAGDADMTLLRVGSLTVDRVSVGRDNVQGAVGGDVSPDGTFVLVKSYLTMYRWAWDASLDLPFVGEPITVPYVPEPQGEAVAITADGTGYFTLSERVGDRVPRLYAYRFR